jgi:hypothetical protein
MLNGGAGVDLIAALASSFFTPPTQIGIELPI